MNHAKRHRRKMNAHRRKWGIRGRKGGKGSAWTKASAVKRADRLKKKRAKKESNSYLKGQGGKDAIV